jgi:hypothetical protein
MKAMRFYPILFLGAAALAQTADPGPKMGTKVPEFALFDQAGASRKLASLMGPKGMLLVFTRSADW